MRFFLAAILAAAAAGTAAAQNSHTGDFTFREQSTTGNFGFQQQQSTGRFELNVDLGSMSQSGVLDELVALATTKTGGPIVAYGYDQNTGLIVGTTDPNVGLLTINATKDGPGRGEITIVISANDGLRKPVSVRSDGLEVFRDNLEPVCFEQETVQSAPVKISVALLLDRSGSMDPYKATVTDVATRFLNAMPRTAQCQLTSFSGSDRVERHTRDFQQCSPGAHNPGMQARESTGTDFYTPLVETYRTIRQDDPTQAVTILVTDGETTETPHKRTDVTSAKTGRTFVYWAGKHGQRGRQQLRGIADTFLSEEEKIEEAMRAYFEGISTQLTAQTVLIVKDC
ncbi:MAG: vWA domain-containing protein [Pseudomonadota bacterium]